jgi:protocatechuate 3,4-dioxygenase beta subunit
LPKANPARRFNGALKENPMKIHNFSRRAALACALALVPGAAAANPTAGTITHDLDANTRTLNVMGRAQPKTPSFPKLTPRKGFVRGYVKDAKGKPLPNARLGVRSTAFGGAYSGAQGKTDARGYYQIAVPFGAAHFYNAGYAVSYGDGRAALGLHPRTAS